MIDKSLAQPRLVQRKTGRWGQGGPRVYARLAATAVVLALAIIALVLPVAAYATTPVTFIDSHLESAVRSALGKPTGTVTDMDMLALTSLTAENANICNLDGLEYARNLGELHLANNHITTITPVAGLTSLTLLYLGNNQISDISPVAGLVNLKCLSIPSNQVVDITAVHGLTSLWSLILNYNQVRDITPVANMIYVPRFWTFAYGNRLDLTPGSVDRQAIDTIGRRGSQIYTGDQQMCTLTPSAGPHGTVSPATSRSVYYETDATFTITPDSGYHVADVLVDGVSVGAVNQYVFHSVMASHTLCVTFGIDTFSIVPSSGAHGSIAPSSTQTVERGSDSATFTICPDQGYRISDVLVDGASVGTITAYAFRNVAADHTISATFERAGVFFRCEKLEAAVRVALNKPTGDITEADMLGLTSLTAENADICSLEGLQYATNLNELILENNRITDITPVAGLTSLTLLYLGNNQISDISPVAGLVNLKCLSIPSNQVVDITAVHGLTSLWSLILNYNQVRDITPVANMIYVPRFWTFAYGNRLDLTPGSDDMQAIDTIGRRGSQVYTSDQQMCTISPSASENGTISPAVSTAVYYDADATFTVTPDAGYHVSDVLVDGVSVGACLQYVFQDVSADHTISASFEQDQQ